ncbi:MAG: phenylalanine--tRNA ligase subunit beta [Dehalococcoidia bacterium]
MKVPLSWLKEYIDVNLSPEEISHKLTMAGNEVDSIEKIGIIDNVYTGEIIHIEKHPNADRLNLVTVSLIDEEHKVVCGANNININDKIVFAKEGAILHDAYSEESKLIKLKKSKIRGILSSGMVCSAKELGIGNDHEGVIILPQNTKIGIPISEILGDVIFDFELTPNRPDCLGVIGLARDLGALTGEKINDIDISFEGTVDDINSDLKITIENPELCSRYTATIIENIKIQPSPQWLQNRLLAIGERPVNNIVDITNYVMFETGQPLHAFDRKKITDTKINVRRANKEENLVTLDGKKRNLDDSMVVISDSKSSIGLAGIMGGENSEVSNDTTSIVLESATWNATNNRETAKKLDLNSQATLRFEKGLKKGLSEIGLRRAIKLILDITDGVTSNTIIDINTSNNPHTDLILFEYEKIKKVLGIKIEKKIIESTLDLLGFKLKSNSNGWEIEVPYWRPDITIQEDIVEELARIIGYDDIPTTILSGEPPPSISQEFIHLREKISDVLVSLGMYEVINYPTTSIDGEKRVLINSEEPKFIKLKNPVNSEFPIMRRTLIERIIENIAKNSKVWKDPIKIFELGKVFHDNGGRKPEEPYYIVGGFAGPRNEINWDSENKDIDFFDVKGVIESIFEEINVKPKFEILENSLFVKGVCAEIKIFDENIGMLGQINKNVLEKFNSEIEEIFIFELSIEKIFKIISQKRDLLEKKFKEYNRLPSSYRDLSLVVNSDIFVADLINQIANNKLIKSINIFDVFEGKGVPKNKKAIGLRLTFQSKNKTITSQEINKSEQRIISELKNNFDVDIRE